MFGVAETSPFFYSLRSVPFAGTLLTFSPFAVILLNAQRSRMGQISKTQQFRLGLFILVASALTVIFLVMVAGNKLLEKRDTYFVRYLDTSVNGLQIGGQVQYHGIRIGRVEDISIDRRDVRQVVVELSIKAGTPIKADVLATLSPVGITGLMQIELTGGSNEADLLKPGDTIPAGNSALENITGRAEVIAEKLELILNNLADLTNPPQRQRFKNILAHLDTVVDRGREPLLNSLENLETVSSRLTRLVDRSDSLVQEATLLLANASLKRGLAQLDSVTAQLAAVDFRELSTGLQEAVSAFSNTLTHADLLVLKGRTDLLESLASLRETMEYLNEFSRRISEDPSLLLRSSGKD